MYKEEKNTFRFSLQVAQGIPKHLDDELSKEYSETSEEEVSHVKMIYFFVCEMKIKLVFLLQFF